MGRKREAEPVETTPAKPKRMPKASQTADTVTVPTMLSPRSGHTQNHASNCAATIPAAVVAPSTDQAMMDAPALSKARRTTSPSPIVYRTRPALGEKDADIADVYALPNFETDGRTDTKSRKFVGQVLNNPDWMRQVSALYGPGYYFFLPRKRDGKLAGGISTFVPPMFGEVPTEEAEEDEIDGFDFDDESELVTEQLRNRNLQLEIELARLKERERLRAEMTPVRTSAPTPAAPTLTDQIELLLKLDKLRGAQPQPSPPQSISAPKSLLEQLRELEEVRALLAPKVESQPNPAPMAVDSLASVAVALFNSAQGDDAKEGALAAVQRLFGLDVEPQRPWWQELAISLAQNEMVGQAIAPLIGTVSQFSLNQMAKVQGASAQPQQQPPAKTAATPTTPPPTPQSEPRGRRLSPEEALEVVFADWRANQPVERAAGIVQQMLNHPQYGMMLQAILAADPADTIAQLAPMNPDLPTLPHSQEWLTKLIKSFANEETEDGIDKAENVPNTGAAVAEVVTPTISAQTATAGR